MRFVAAVGQEGAQRQRRHVARQQTRQHQHRMAVASRREAQQRRHREEGAQLGDGAHLEQQKFGRGRSGRIGRRHGVQSRMA